MMERAEEFKQYIFKSFRFLDVVQRDALWQLIHTLNHYEVIIMDNQRRIKQLENRLLDMEENEERRI